MNDLPLELLEIVLMRTFVMLYSTDSKARFDRRLRAKAGKSKDSERQAFIVLASVCLEWRYGLTGWPQSPTRLWVRHQLKKLIERECTCSYTVSGLTVIFNIFRVVLPVKLFAMKFGTEVCPLGSCVAKV